MPPGAAPEGCEILLLSPFEIHFSQTRIRDQFQDGNTVEKAVSLVTFAAPKDGDEYPDESEREKTDDLQVADHPFPRIEVTRWRCKLREPDGSPKLDSAGMELYSHEERWFTFDNRRLYCLQRAATSVFPREVRCEVVAVPGDLAKTRELRKFDTRSFGLSVVVGKREDNKEERREGAAGERWNWRAAVGLPEELPPEDGIGRRPSTRYRGRDRRDGSGPGSGRRRAEEAEEGNGTLELVRSALLFFLVYLALRVVVSIFRHHFAKGTPVEAVAEAVVEGSTTMIPS